MGENGLGLWVGRGSWLVLEDGKVGRGMLSFEFLLSNTRQGALISFRDCDQYGDTLTVETEIDGLRLS